MIINAKIYTCDICKRKEVVSTDGGSSDGWQDFYIDDINSWMVKNPMPSQLCPSCAKKVKLAIANVTDAIRNF